MNYRRVNSDVPNSPYAPYWDYTIGSVLTQGIDLHLLSKTCLDKEKEIKKLPIQRLNGRVRDGYTGLGKSSTTAKFLSYNVLKWNTRETNKLKSNIATALNEYNTYLKNPTVPVWIHCWVNILRWGQSIKPHSHQYNSVSYLSGHFNVQVQDTSTCYMSPINQLNDPYIIDKPNIPGELTLFPSYIFHYTTKHYSFKPRITIAFDMTLNRAHSDSSILL